MTPWTQAKAWALREVWRDERKKQKQKGDHGLLTYVASKLTTKAEGNAKGAAPSVAALSQFYNKIDNDKKWFPGKRYGDPPGRPTAITETNKAVIARSLMAYSEKGGEPTYSVAVSLCPQATLNPATGKHVDKRAIYDIMETKCHDGDPDNPWKNKARLSRTMLTPEDIAKRFAWAKWMQTLRHSAHWYYWRVVWADVCNNILPRSFKKAQLQAQARKRGKTWRSDGSQKKSKNLRGPSSATKQNSWDAIRVWWIPLLLRGKLHIEVLDTSFPGECPEGMPAFVAKVRAAINIRCQGDDKPTTVFTDRGKGFYHSNNGYITDEYKAALHEHRIKAFLGDDGQQQPGDLQDMMLHETAVAWIRLRQKVTVPAKPWEETVEDFTERMKGIAAYINENYDVEGLCRELPDRLEELVEREGDRLDE